MNAIAENPPPPLDAAPHPERRTFRNRLFSNAFWLMGGRVASIGSVFAVAVLLGRNLSIADFAAYTIATAAVGFLSMPATLGAPRVVLRLIREGLAVHQPQRSLDSIRSCAQVVAISSVVIALLFLVGVRFLDDADKWRAVRDYGLLVAAWFSLSAMCMAVAHALQGFDDFRTSAMVGARSGGILANVLVLVVLAIALPLGQLTLRLALTAQVVLNAIALAYGWYRLQACIRLRAPAAHTTSRVQPGDHVSLRWFFGECWPILLIQLTSLGISQLDVLLVGWLTNDRDIAIYGAIARLGDPLGAMQILATGIAAPFISELYATDQRQKLERLLRGIASFSAIPGLVIGAIYLAAPRMALGRTFGPEFADGALALQIATVGSCIASLSGMNSLTMIMTGQQRQLMRISTVACAVYLVVAPLLISVWGLAGAATATAFVFGGYNVIVTLMVKKQLGIWTVASLSPADYLYAIRRLMKK